MNYAVCSPTELRTLCINNEWFTCGSNEQYEKLFDANRENAPLEEIAIIIWVCSDNVDKKEVLKTLEQARQKYLDCISAE